MASRRRLAPKKSEGALPSPGIFNFLTHFDASVLGERPLTVMINSFFRSAPLRFPFWAVAEDEARGEGPVFVPFGGE